MRTSRLSLLLQAIVLAGLAACGGGGGDGPRVTANLQSLSFGNVPALMVGQRANVAAVASSGLAPQYASNTPAVCAVDSASGQVSTLAAGTCTLSASQAGNEAWAPVAATLTFPVQVDPRQRVSFAAAPPLSLGGTASVSATATSGLAVAYSSLTPSVCTVDSASGQVTNLALGDCTVAADQPGNATYNAAAQALQTLVVQVPAGVTVPGVPQGVAATLGADASSVVVSFSGVDSGGSPVTGVTVASSPAGVSVNALASPVEVHCPGGCAGKAFSVRASNLVGTGTASPAAEVLTTFRVLSTFREPDTQPRDTLFTGSFTLNSTTGAITGLAGQLTESMTGNAVGAGPYFDMTQVPLAHQLVTRRDAALGGTFVASFAKTTTSTFTTFGGGDGWSPEAGVANGGVFAGFPARHASSIQNAYILVFVPDDPFAPLTAAQIDKLAYADCAPGGMMGAVCMTATSVAGHGAVGTMSGFPLSQVISKP
jgi:hypothetical protein